MSVIIFDIRYFNEPSDIPMLEGKESIHTLNLRIRRFPSIIHDLPSSLWSCCTMSIPKSGRLDRVMP